MDTKFTPTRYANSADTVLIGEISQYELVTVNNRGVTSEFARFFVTPKQTLSGNPEEPFWAIWRSTARFSPPGFKQGAWLMALNWQRQSHKPSTLKEDFPKATGDRLFEIYQDLCYPETWIFRPHSPEAQAIIEVLRKQTEVD
jgi:hypothetical protein